MVTAARPRSRPIRVATQRVAFAAGAGLAAVRIMDAHEDIRALGPRFQADELVAADPQPPVRDQADPVSRQAQPLGAPVQHDEVVPSPVHLDEGDLPCAGLIGAGRFSRKSDNGGPLLS